MLEVTRVDQVLHTAYQPLRYKHNVARTVNNGHGKRMEVRCLSETLQDYVSYSNRLKLTLDTLYHLRRTPRETSRTNSV